MPKQAPSLTERPVRQVVSDPTEPNPPPTNLPVTQPTTPQVDKPLTFPKFSVHNIDPKIVKRVKQLAVGKDRTMSDMVTEALTSLLERYGG